jgi:hypothetical protein
MLHARVGVAPGTTTLRLGDGQLGIQCFPVPPPNRVGMPMPQVTLPAATTEIVAPSPGGWRFMVPYATMTDMKGLGIINETDRWMTGTPNRLPGTIVLRIPGRADQGLGIGPDDLLPPSDEPSTVTMRTGIVAALAAGTLAVGALIGFTVGRRR